MSEKLKVCTECEYHFEYGRQCGRNAMCRFAANKMEAPDLDCVTGRPIFNFKSCFVRNIEGECPHYKKKHWLKLWWKKYVEPF